jgi:predicted Zn-dependent peptidase
VLGTEQSVGALRVDQMRGYFQERYSPGNIVLAAAGKVDFDALARQAERLCAGWEGTAARRDVTRAEPHEGFHVVHRESSVQAAAPAATDPDRFAARLLATVLGDDSGSRLYWKLVDSGLAEHAGLDHFEFDGSGAFMTNMSCDPPRAAKNLQLLHQAYREAEEGKLSSRKTS